MIDEREVITDKEKYVEWMRSWNSFGEYREYLMNPKKHYSRDLVNRCLDDLEDIEFDQQKDHYHESRKDDREWIITKLIDIMVAMDRLEANE